MSRLLARFNIRFPAFHLNVDVDVPMSGITAIFGPSGSGKTTLLRCLAGLERAPEGFMQVGEDLWQDESRGYCLPLYERPIGYVFQEPRLFLITTSVRICCTATTAFPERTPHWDGTGR